MKMLKRTLALMLALIMMFSAVPFNAYATESTDQPSVPTEAPVDAPETEEPAAEEPVVEDEVVEEPVVEEPAEEEEVVEAPQSRAVPASNTVAYKYNVVHLDAGRKYFSVDNIKAIIDNIDAAGFNQLNLYLSDNQGFRFALDDMTLTTDYGTYNLTPALGDGYSSSDNKAPDGTGMYLTQSEMDTIITYAHSKGIDIVPAINVPGHMGAILEEFPSFCYKKGYSTSKSSIDLANDEAVAFALALTEKYAAYFASKGCKYYCVGADEYANDLSSMGFEGMGSTLYTKFVQFLNDAADIVIDLGMTPRAFNDGFYYKDYRVSVEPNKAYEVYYWSSGWSGYDVAAASTISAKGHKMINTHGDYYWVLGKSDWQCSASKASGFSTTAFQGSTVSNPAGSMFCIWCDVGDDDSSENVITATAPVIAAFGSVLPEVEALVSGVVTPDPEPETPADVTKTDEATKVEITAPGLTDLTVTVVDEVPTIEGAAEGKVLAWDMTPATAEGKYEGEATVAVPVPADWDASKMGAFVIEADNSVKLIDGAVNADGNFEFTMPHFSVGGVYEVAAAAEELKDTVAAGTGTATSYVLDKDGLDVNAQYLIVSNGIVSNGNALTNNKDSLAVTVNGDNATPSGDATDALWTYTSWRYGSRYGLMSGSNYLYPSLTSSGSIFNPSYSYNLNIDGNQTRLSITNNNNGTYSIANSSNSAYVAYTSNVWGAQSSSQNLSFYKYTAGTQTYTVDAALQESRINAVANIPNEGYTDDSWNAYQAALTAAQAKLAEIKGKSYTVKSDADAALNDLIDLVDALEAAKNALEKSVQITIKYVDENGTTVKTETMNVSDKATSVTLTSPIYSQAGDCYIFENTNLALVSGKTEYTVKVTYTEEDLTTVAPLDIEFWITNHPVTPDNQDVNTSKVDHNSDTQKNMQRIWTEVLATRDSIHSANGVALTSLVAASGVDSHMSNIVVFWRGVALDNNTHQQTTDANDNESYSGTVFTRVRYWERNWQVFDGSEWVKVTEDTQLVAYYLQKTTVTNLDVIQTEVVDWGEVYGESGYSDSNFVALDFALKYENGTRNPDSFAVDGKTLMFHCNYNRPANGGALGETVFQEGTTYYRRIGTIRATETSNYEVYMITVTPNSDNKSTSVASSADYINTINYAGTEKVIWVDSVENLGKFEDKNLQHADFTIGGEPTLQKLDIYNKQAVLVTYYLRAKVTQDSLTVHYMDRTAGNIEFYNYNIAVAEGTLFDSGIKLPSPWKGNLVNGTIQTIDPNVKQPVSSDLATLPQVAAQYLYSQYECVEVVRSEDGKHVYLYYTFNPTVTFVADFGLPIEIKATDLNASLNGIVSDMAITGGSYTAYGQLIDKGTTITYKPTKVMRGSDFFTILVTTTKDSGILDSATTQIAFRVYVVPATTVYYGEKFISFDGNWSTEGTDAGNVQKTEVLGSQSSHYGYDTTYNAIGASDGTSKTAVTLGAKATFEFTGDGLQLFANCTEKSGNVSVVVKDKATKKTVNMTMVDTVVKGETNSQISGGQTGNLAGLPIISLVDLQNIPHSTYTVTITKILDSDDTVYIDGFRVFNTIDETGVTPEKSIYSKDLEDLPDFYEMRDAVLTAMNITIVDSDDYETLYQQLHDAIVLTGESAVITSASAEYGANDRQDLLDNGPKNELYLFPGDTLTFNVKTDRAMQLGMKAPNAAVNAEVTVDGTTTTQAVSSSVDMFYQLKGDTTKATHSISIKNSSNSGILSVTLLKICDDPSFAFAPLTEDNIKAILADAGYTDGTETPDEPEVPEETTKPTEPEVEETTKPSKPQKPSKPEKPGKPENTKPTEPQKPSKPGNNGNQKPGKEEKTYTLKITFVNLFGKKVGTATITTTNGVVSAYEINGKAPAGYHAIWLIPVTLRANGNTSVVVPVI